MKVYVNGRQVTVIPGMTVQHALIAADQWHPQEYGKIRDEWGNEIGRRPSRRHDDFY